MNKCEDFYSDMNSSLYREEKKREKFWLMCKLKFIFKSFIL